MDILFETILPAFGRMLIYLIVEIIYNTICYLTGYVVIKVLTAGKYPKEFTLSEGMNEPGNVFLAGLVAWIIFIMYLCL